MRERIRIETGSKPPQSAGGTKWVTTSTVTRWAEAVLVTAEALSRYQSIDAKVTHEFRFRDRPTITMKTTRFVWMSDGHPNKLKVYYPAAPAENVDGIGRYTSVLVVDSGEVASV